MFTVTFVISTMVVVNTSVTIHYIVIFVHVVLVILYKLINIIAHVSVTILMRILIYLIIALVNPTCSNNNGGCEQMCTQANNIVICSCFSGYQIYNKLHCSGIVI